MIRLIGLLGGPSLLPWAILGGLCCILGLTGGAYLKGRADVAATCRAAELSAEIAGLQRDLAALKAAEKIDRQLRQELIAVREALQKQVADYEADLATRPNGLCALDGRDLEWLRYGGQR